MSNPNSPPVGPKLITPWATRKTLPPHPHPSSNLSSHAHSGQSSGSSYRPGQEHLPSDERSERGVLRGRGRGRGGFYPSHPHSQSHSNPNSHSNGYSHSSTTAPAYPSPVGRWGERGRGGFGTGNYGVPPHQQPHQQPHHHHHHQQNQQQQAGTSTSSSQPTPHAPGSTAPLVPNLAVGTRSELPPRPGSFAHSHSQSQSQSYSHPATPHPLPNPTSTSSTLPFRGRGPPTGPRRRSPSPPSPAPAPGPGHGHGYGHGAGNEQAAGPVGEREKEDRARLDRPGPERPDRPERSEREERGRPRGRPYAHTPHVPRGTFRSTFPIPGRPVAGGTVHAVSPGTGTGAGRGRGLGIPTAPRSDRMREPGLVGSTSGGPGPGPGPASASASASAGSGVGREREWDEKRGFKRTFSALDHSGTSERGGRSVSPSSSRAGAGPGTGTGAGAGWASSGQASRERTELGYTGRSRYGSPSSSRSSPRKPKPVVPFGTGLVTVRDPTPPHTVLNAYQSHSGPQGRSDPSRLVPSGVGAPRFPIPTAPHTIQGRAGTTNDNHSLDGISTSSTAAGLGVGNWARRKEMDRLMREMRDGGIPPSDVVTGAGAGEPVVLKPKIEPVETTREEVREKRTRVTRWDDGFKKIQDQVREKVEQVKQSVAQGGTVGTVDQVGQTRLDELEDVDAHADADADEPDTPEEIVVDLPDPMDLKGKEVQNEPVLLPQKDSIAPKSPRAGDRKEEVPVRREPSPIRARSSPLTPPTPPMADEEMPKVDEVLELDSATPRLPAEAPTPIDMREEPVQSVVEVKMEITPEKTSQLELPREETPGTPPLPEPTSPPAVQDSVQVDHQPSSPLTEMLVSSPARSPSPESERAETSPSPVSAPALGVTWKDEDNERSPDKVTETQVSSPRSISPTPALDVDDTLSEVSLQGYGKEYMDFEPSTFEAAKELLTARQKPLVIEIDHAVDSVLNENSFGRDRPNVRAEQAGQVDSWQIARQLASVQAGRVRHVVARRSLMAKEAHKKAIKALQEEWKRLDDEWQEQRIILEEENEQLRKMAEAAAVPPTPAPDKDARPAPRNRRRGAPDVEQQMLGIHDGDEAGLERILQAIRQAEEADPIARARKTEAVIPDMIMDPAGYTIFYDDNSSLVQNPLEFYDMERKTSLPWTEEEDVEFRKLYTQFPKRFGEIADRLPGRSFHECVDHYYLAKKVKAFKEPARGAARQYKEVSISSIVNSRNTITTPRTRLVGMVRTNKTALVSEPAVETPSRPVDPPIPTTSRKPAKRKTEEPERPISIAPAPAKEEAPTPAPVKVRKKPGPKPGTKRKTAASVASATAQGDPNGPAQAGEPSTPATGKKKRVAKPRSKKAAEPAPEQDAEGSQRMVPQTPLENRSRENMVPGGLDDTPTSLGPNQFQTPTPTLTYPHQNSFRPGPQVGSWSDYRQLDAGPSHSPAPPPAPTQPYLPSIRNFLTPNHPQKHSIFDRGQTPQPLYGNHPSGSMPGLFVQTPSNSTYSNLPESQMDHRQSTFPILPPTPLVRQDPLKKETSAPPQLYRRSNINDLLNASSEPDGGRAMSESVTTIPLGNVAEARSSTQFARPTLANMTRARSVSSDATEDDGRLAEQSQRMEEQTDSIRLGRDERSFPITSKDYGRSLPFQQ